MANPYDTLVPSAPTAPMYGLPAGQDEVAQDQAAAQTGRPPAYVTVGRHGVTARAFGGTADRGHPSNAQQRPGAAPSAAPGFNDFAEYYSKANSTPDKPMNLSSLSDEDWLGIGNEYAKHYVPGMLEGAGYKPDKPTVDEYTNHFMMELYRNLPAIKNHYAQQANATGAPAPTSNMDVITGAALKPGVSALGTAAGNTLKELPKMAGKAAGTIRESFLNYGLGPYDPNGSGVEHYLQEKLGLKDQGEGVAQDVEKAVTGATQPIADKAGDQLRAKSSELMQNMTPAEQQAMKNHPWVANVSQFLGGATPVLATLALTKNPAVLGTLGAAQGGGTARQEEIDRINGMSEEDLNKIPEYKKLVEKTGDPAKAKEALGQAAGNAAGMWGELFGGATNLYGGGALTKTGQEAIKKLVGDVAWKRVVASMLGEGAGFTAAGAGQQVAQTKAVNQLTGENREPDVWNGAPSNFLLGTIFGGLGAYGGLKNPLAKGGKPAEPTPGAKPSAEAAPPSATPRAAEQGASPYQQARDAILADPEHAVQSGTSAEEALPTLTEALDQFNARYAALHDGATPEQKAQASNQFEKEWKQKFGVQEAQPVTPQEGVISPAEAAAAVGEPAQPEPPAVSPAEVRQAHEDANVSPGEARSAAPEAEPLSTRELVTQPGVDTSLPFGVTERIAEELRTKNERPPTASEINQYAKIFLDTALGQKGINRFLPLTARREAVGKLIEQAGDHATIPTADEINKTANRLLSVGDVQATIDARLKEFSKANPIQQLGHEPKTEPLKQLGHEPKAEPPKQLGHEKTNRLLTHEPTDITVKPSGTNVLRKGAKSGERVTGPGLTEQAPLPKTNAAEPKEGEAAHSRTKDEFGNTTTGRTVDDLRQALVDKWSASAIKALEKSGVLRLVQSMRDLQRLEPGSVAPRYITQGYYNGRAGYLVADHIPKGEEVGVLLHEVGAHYGLKRMLPKELFEQLREHVRNNIDVDPEITQAYQTAIKGDPNPHLAEEETIAHMVQANGEVKGSIWRKAWTTLKAWVYKTFGEHLPSTVRQSLINNDVIRQLVRGATKPQGLDKYIEQPAFSRKPTAFKSLDEVRDAWHNTAEPTKEATAEAKESRMQNWATKHVNELKPLQYLNRALAKLGITVTPDKDIFGSMTRLSSRAQFESDHDAANYVDPALNKFVELAKQLGFKGKEEFKTFIAHATDAIAARHALERNKLLYYQTARLSDAAEAKRAALLQDVFKGKLKPEQYMPELKKIVNAPGARIETGGKRAGSGISDEMAYKLIENAKSAGITDDVAHQINEALNPIRERTLENGQRSKRYTPEQRAIQQAYGFKWYLPFKGFAEDTPMGVDGSRRPLGAFNKDTKYMEGRTTQANNPLENLLADLSASSRDVAYNETAGTIFKAASDPAINKKLGAKIKSYNINRMTEDALAGGGKLADMDSVFRSPNTVIFNNGEHRFSVEFPESSKELEAIKSVQKENTLDGVSKAVGRLTNLFARAKTAYSPVFDLFTALVRDTSTYPLMASLDHGPAVVARYGGNLAKFGGPLGAWRTYVGALRGKSFAEIEKRALDNPDSFAGWAYRLSKAGGGLEFRQELNNVKKADDIAEKMAKSSTSALASPKQAGKNFLSFLDSFATASIATGRVSMFKALVESGVSESEAALYTKRLLNFQQTSEGSRRLNAYFAFWRAGIANADRLYEFVHKPDGSFDRGKFGKILTLGVASAAAWNGVLKAYYGDDAKKLTQDTLSKNFVLPLEYNGEPVKLPMGLGLPRLMLGLGMLGTRLVEGDASMKDTLEATKNTLFENLSPLKPSQSKENATAGERAMDLLMATVPSPARPVVELERNQSIFGRKITPDVNENTFRSDSGMRSTPEQWKELAKGVHDITGMDVFPESLEYLSNSYGAGFMTELLRGFQLQNKEEQGKDTSVVDYPFVPRFTTGDIKYATSRDFYEHRDQLKDAVKEANALKADGKPIPNALQKQVDKEKEFESAQRGHSKVVKEIESNTLLSKEAKAAQLSRENDRFKREQQKLVR